MLSDRLVELSDRWCGCDERSARCWIVEMILSLFGRDTFYDRHNQ